MWSRTTLRRIVLRPHALLGFARSTTRAATVRCRDERSGSATTIRFVTSWRDGASQEAQDDLDGLVAATLPLAQKMLAEHGEFYPFAAQVTEAGEIGMVAAAVDDASRPPSSDVIEGLYEGLARLASESRAVAVASDVRIASNSDAIRVEVEHRDGIAIAVLLPYTTKRFGRGHEFGALAAGTAERRIWL